MKKILILSISVIIAASISSFFLPTPSELAVYDNFIRLHVIANSDSEDDQALKLRVRDRVLEIVADRLSDAETKADAEEKMRELLPELESAAADVVGDAGRGDTVKATLTEEKYPRRSYEGVMLPSGTYTSLRIIIGEGEGHNWWCVLFPRLCTKPAVSESARREEFTEAGFTPSQYRIITDSENSRYVVKFRIIEIIKSIFG